MIEPKAEGEHQIQWRQWALVRLVCYIASVVAIAIGATMLTRLLVPPAPSPWHDLVWIKNLLLPLAMFALYARLVRVMEHRAAQEVDVRKQLSNFLLGCLIGCGVIASYTLLLLGLGMIQIADGTGLTGLAAALVIPLVTSMGEELLFRVMIFGILEEVFGSFVAVLTSAALFGLAHIANPGATPFTISALSIELGVLLALAYIVTRNIWLPVGIHMAWNFTEGFVLGAYNSGVRDPHTYFRTSLSGPDLMTGGTFGPEGSVLTLAVSIVVSTILFLVIRRKGQWQAARFRPCRSAPTRSVLRSS